MYLVRHLLIANFTNKTITVSGSHCLRRLVVPVSVKTSRVSDFVCNVHIQQKYIDSYSADKKLYEGQMARYRSGVCPVFNFRLCSK